MLMRQRCHLFHGVNRTQRVRDVIHRHQFRALTQEFTIRLHIERPVRVHWDDLDREAALRRQQLPGNDV